MRVLLLCSLLLAFTSPLAFAHDDLEESPWFWQLDRARNCQKATARQKALVAQGNAKKDKFLQRCRQVTDNSPWCEQLLRPNPDSIDVFRCTYGDDLPHQLIHPNEDTWPDAIKAVRLVKDLEALGVSTCLIYNWWRPEPYNRNVGGSPRRHPYGTSVDVRFCSFEDMERAFEHLCVWRGLGRLRAIGYYGTTALHFGIGDTKANTWGKSCP